MNRFKQLQDSDDEAAAPIKTVAKKSEPKKVTKKRVVAQEDDGFEAVQQRTLPQAGSKGTMRGRDGRASHRGGRGGRVQRPRNAYTTNAEGEQTHDKVNKPRKPFIGKSREEAHPYDRRSGTGRGKRDQQKGGHGKGNWGEEKPVYKVKGSEEEEEKEATEEPKKEVKEEPKVEEPVVEVIEVGTTLADFKKNKAIPAKKEARKAEDITGSNIQSFEKQDDGVKIIESKLTGGESYARQAETDMLGFVAKDDDEEEEENRRGGRGGRGRKGKAGGRNTFTRGKGNQKANLKVTEDAFPTLQ